MPGCSKERRLSGLFCRSHETFAALAVCLGQTSERLPLHTLTVGFGAGLPQGRITDGDRFLKGPALVMDYEIRPYRHFGLDAGLDLVFRTDNELCFAPRGCPPPEPAGHAWLIPFGARVLFPLSSDTIELLAGAGGAKAHYDTFHVPYDRNGWGGQANAGLRWKFGPRKRWSAGFLGRYYRIPNSAYLKEQWVTLFGTFGRSF